MNIQNIETVLNTNFLNVITKGNHFDCEYTNERLNEFNIKKIKVLHHLNLEFRKYANNLRVYAKNLKNGKKIVYNEENNKWNSFNENCKVNGDKLSLNESMDLVGDIKLSEDTKSWSVSPLSINNGLYHIEVKDYNIVHNKELDGYVLLVSVAQLNN